MAFSETLSASVASTIDVFKLYERNWSELKDASVLLRLVRETDCTHDDIRHILGISNRAMCQQHALNNHASAHEFKKLIGVLEAELADSQ